MRQTVTFVLQFGGIAAILYGVKHLYQGQEVPTYAIVLSFVLYLFLFSFIGTHVVKWMFGEGSDDDADGEEDG